MFAISCFIMICLTYAIKLYKIDNFMNICDARPGGMTIKA